jgi:protein-disulfide isomerase
MSIFSKGPFQDRTSPVKPILIVLVVLLVLGGFYSFSNKKKNPDVAKTADGSSALVAKPSGLDKDERVKTVGDVEKVIAKWVEANPELVIQSVVNMQQKAVKQQMQDAQKSISSKTNDIFNYKNDPVFAPKDADVTVVEFFDYNCGYCKRSQATVEKLLDDDKKVKVIFKEFPILGPSSEELAKVSIALNMVDAANYVKFHNALMKSSAKNRDDALKIAGSVGANVDKIKKTLDASKNDIDAQIAFNRQLGGSIGINGTPAFIVGEELISGAVEISVLKEKIADLRKAKK